MANKGGFSWKRATGVSAAKSKISKKIGVPLTKSGRQQKLGKTLSGCCIPLCLFIAATISVCITL